MGKMILKFIRNCKGPQRAKTILKNKGQTWRIHTSQFQNLLQSYGSQAMRIWHKDRHTDQRNRIGNPLKNPHTYGYLIFNKAAKVIQWGKEQFLQQTMLGELNMHMQKNEADGPTCHNIHKT